MIGQGMHGFVENKELEIDDIDAALREPTDKRVFVISKAMHKGYTVDQIHDLTKIDKWFLEKLKHIIDIDEAMKKCNINTIDKDLLRTAKVYGFTDFQVARAVGLEQELGNMHKAALLVRNKRKSYGILPVVKQIDTLSSRVSCSDQLPLCNLRRREERHHASRTTIVLSSYSVRVLTASVLP